MLFCTRLRWKLAGIEFGEYLANAPDNLIRAMIMEDVQTGLEEAPKAFLTGMGITSRACAAEVSIAPDQPYAPGGRLLAHRLEAFP